MARRGGAPGATPSRHLVKGLPVSGGIVIGRVLVIDDSMRRVVRRAIEAGDVKGEIARFDVAIKASVAEVRKVHEQAERDMGKEAAKIFSFHVGMLSDPSLLMQVRTMIENERVTAEYATTHVLDKIASQFRLHKDPVFATKVNDIDDLTDRLMAQLVVGSGMGGGKRLQSADANTIIVARDLTPSQTASFDRSRILGFATDLGGMTSHTAIIAKALEIPAVVGCQTLLNAAQDGDSIVLDGDHGVVILHPDEATIKQYEEAIEHRRKAQVLLTELRDLPSVTTDGLAVKLVGNIELPDEVERVFAYGGEGIGLYRTEYLYLTGDDEPTEGVHYRAYKQCVKLCKGHELVIRTMDLGADKYTQAQAEVPERNPFLGCRSIRYCLKNQPMFKKQLRAILRASAEGTIKLMFPLISTINELRQAKFIVNDVMEELDEEGLPFDRNIKMGMMVEVPSAAIQAETFARECDFFSIGTNDLVQYTLAVDRINERVANLYNPMHPAVIRLIRDVARAGRRQQIPVSCCGEASGDLEFAMLLIGLDVTTLSVSASTIPRLKKFIRSISRESCEKVARQTLALESDVQVAAFLRDRSRKLAPHCFEDSVENE